METAWQVILLGIGLSVLGIGGTVTLRHPLFLVTGGLGAIIVLFGVALLAG